MILQPKPCRPGVTAPGLIVVLVLLLIGVALLAPVIARLRMMAGRSEGMNNLKQLAIAAINCADTSQGKLAPAVGMMFPDKPAGTLHYFLLPFIEQNALFQKAGGNDGS